MSQASAQKAFQPRLSLTTISPSSGTHVFLTTLIRPSRTLVLLIDLFVAFAGSLAASWLIFYIGPFSFKFENIAVSVCYSLYFAVFGLSLGYYDRENRYNPKTFLAFGAIAAVLSIISTLFTIHFLFYRQLGRILLLFAVTGGTLALLGARLLLAFLLRNFTYKYVVFGTDSRITMEIKHSQRTSRISRHFQNAADIEGWIANPENDDPEALIEMLKRQNISEIILTKEAMSDERLVRLSMLALRSGHRVTDEVSFYTEVFERYPVEALSQDWILISGINTHKHFSNFLKRGFDITASALALTLLSPVLALIALAIKLSSPGPAIFIQQRQGRFCFPFNIYKFRTMRVAQDLDKDNPSTFEKDPRVTGIGKLIRPLHLDELPQLFNIFKGQMSFVGPRPEDLRFAAEIRKDVPIYDYRHLLRPGLTGPAQLNLGYTFNTVDDTYRKLAYDLYYLKHQGLFIDFIYILRTFFFLTRRAR